MDEGWWYAHGDDRQGPLSAEQIRHRLHAGTIDAQTLVWRPGRLAWKPLHQVAELVPGMRLEPVLLDPASAAPVRTAPPLPEPDLPAAPPDPAVPAGGEPWLAAGAIEAPAPRAAAAAHAAAGPWRRLFARCFDVWTMAVPAGMFLGAVGGHLWPAFGLWMQSPSAAPLLGVILVPLALVFEAVVFGLFGSTPGKFLFGVRVTLQDGGRPTFIQYLGRMARMYLSGLGLGIPFVTLITMGLQYANLNKGRAASYDHERFLVHERGAGMLRTGLATLAFAGLVAGLAYIHQQEAERNLRYFAGFEWTNPATRMRADIPRGWQYRQELNGSGDVIHTFFSDTVVAVFASEGGVERMRLDEYMRLWAMAMRQAMTFDGHARIVYVKGRSSLQMKGTMAADTSRQVNATLLKSNGQVWRIVTVGPSGRDPDTAATAALREVLFQTVPAGTADDAPSGPTI